MGNKGHFQRGNTIGRKGGRPKGFSAYSAEERALRALDGETVFRMMNDNLFLTLSEIKEKLNDPDLTVIEISLIRLMLKSCDTGELRILTFFLDRLIGKPTHQPCNVKTEDPYKYCTLEQILEIRGRLYPQSNEILKNMPYELIHGEKL